MSSNSYVINNKRLMYWDSLKLKYVFINYIIQEIYIIKHSIKLMFTDPFEKKKSMHHILRAFYTNNKIFPKLAEERRQKQKSYKIQKFNQLKKYQQARALSFEKQLVKNNKRGTMLQLNSDEDNFCIKNEVVKITKPIAPSIQRPNQKLELVLNRVSYKKYPNQNNLFKDFNLKEFKGIHNYQDRLVNLLLSPHTIINGPQTIDPSTIIQEQQLSYTINVQDQQFKKNQSTPLKKRNLQFNNHDSSHKFYLGPGNNSDLVRRVMKKRIGWSQTSQSNSIFNFRWTQNSQNIKYEGILSNNGCKQMVNHFEFHEQITTKSGLLRNLKTLSEKQQKFNLFDITPITFQIDFKLQQFCQPQLKRFLHYFLENTPVQKQIPKLKRKQEQRKHFLEFLKKIKHIHNLQNHTYEKKQHPNSKPIFKQIYTNGYTYLWLLKPTGLNRGRGIYLFRTLEELADILIEYYERNQKINLSPIIKRQISSVKERSREHSTTIQQNKLNQLVNSFVRSESFVIQKYIQKPMLIHSRKYDIRVWVLLTPDTDLFFFREGYIRTSCEEYDIQKKDLFVHLTNNAVQKNSSNYGNYEKGNQLSFDDLQQIFQKDQNIKNPQDQDENQIHKISFRKDIIPEIKKMIVLPFQSIKKKITGNIQKYCFQIYGFDFMIDQKYKPWLIEINTNPCIEQSSPLLEKLLPRMLDDAFSLALDPIFHSKKKRNIKYPVNNYDDNQNMWQYLCKFKQIQKKKSIKK